MAAVTPADLEGLFKKVYAGKIELLVPEFAYLYKNIAFGEAEKTGDTYNVPVTLTRESGFSYGGADGGAYGLAPSVPMTMKNAALKGCQGTLRSQISMDAASRAVAGGEKAFKSATAMVFESNMASHVERLETHLLYGQSANGLATTASSANVDATHTTVTFTAASWGVGIWGGQEKSKIVFYDNAAARPQVGVGAGGTGVFEITGIDPDTYKLTVKGVAVDIAALDASILGGSVCSAYWYGSTGLTTADNGTGIVSAWAVADSLDMAGLDRIIPNTGSLFGIDAATYSLWKGSTYTISPGAALTMSRVLKAVTRAVGKGGLKEKVTVLVSTPTFTDLSDEVNALRRYDSSYSKSKSNTGVESIEYTGSNGAIEIVPHAMVKAGEAFVAPLKSFSRVGSTEVTFDVPGHGGEMFTLMPNHNGFEFRSYSDQALLGRAPAKCVKIAGIVNS